MRTSRRSPRPDRVAAADLLEAYNRIAGVIAELAPFATRFCFDDSLFRASVRPQLPASDDAAFLATNRSMATSAKFPEWMAWFDHGAGNPHRQGHRGSGKTALASIWSR